MAVTFAKRPSLSTVTTLTAPATADEKKLVIEVELDQIVPSTHQFRRTFDDAAMSELVSSVKESGVIQPAIVRKNSDGTYMLIAGERRWRACKMLREQYKKEGIDKKVLLPCLVREASDTEIALLGLVENVSREDLNAMDEAEGFNRLIEEFGLTHQELSERTGKSRSAITNILKFIELPKETRESIRMGHIGVKSAIAMGALAPQDAINLTRKVERAIDAGSPLSGKQILAEVNAKKAQKEAQKPAQNLAESRASTSGSSNVYREQKEEKSDELQGAIETLRRVKWEHVDADKIARIMAILEE